jgi:hypothetical protein
MAYELFQNKVAKFSSPQLTIRNGGIALNADAGDILAKVGMSFAHLLWMSPRARSRSALSRRRTITHSRSRFRKERGGTFSAQSFLNYIQWRASGPAIVDANWKRPSDVSMLLCLRNT